MTEFFLASASALWLGILTSISPCPLATNIAAVTFVSKKVAHPSLVFIAGLAYTAGRMLAYAALGVLIIGSLVSVPQTAQFLQKYMAQALGPILVVTGLFLLGILTFKAPGLALSQKQHHKLAGSGAAGAFLLGFIFALAFCPVSAALFFGSLIPLALATRAGIALPFLYGIGTGLPVFVFAIAVTLGITSLGRWFDRLARIEYYARRMTGIVFVLAGAYYTAALIMSFF